MKDDLDESNSFSGIPVYKYKGQEYFLSQDPYPCDFTGYKALCVPKNDSDTEDEYYMYWDYTDDYQKCLDAFEISQDEDDLDDYQSEDDVCDWENPCLVIKNNKEI